jgi:uncharacterized protein (TIGR02453 family)
MTTPRFRAFEPTLLDFLDDLALHNDRDWFKLNKARYEDEVVAPAMAFIEAMQPRLERISPHFTAIPKKTGGSMMRIYRDTRFGRDKTPYKTNVGIQFRHELGKDIHAPGFYVHLEPDQVFLGVGLWRPDSAALAAIRGALDADPDGWIQARNHRPFAKRFSLGGDSLKRAPRGYDEDHALIEDLRRKDFIAAEEIAPRDVEKPGITNRISRSFDSSVPFMRFLCSALDVPF